MKIETEQSDISFLAKITGEELLQRLDVITLQPTLIFHPHLANDDFSSRLLERYPKATLVTTSDSLEPHSVDFIFANLFLPWCEEIEKKLQEWRYLLRPNGLLMLTALGPNTLHELQNTPILPHVIDMHNLGDALMQAMFSDPVVDVNHFTVTYRDRTQLLNELQNSSLIQNKPLLSDTDTVFHLTFEIIFGLAWGPDAAVDQVTDEFGVTYIPVSDLKK